MSNRPTLIVVSHLLSAFCPIIANEDPLEVDICCRITKYVSNLNVVDFLLATCNMVRWPAALGEHPGHSHCKAGAPR
jgi:hypothetical protein